MNKNLFLIIVSMVLFSCTPFSEEPDVPALEEPDVQSAYIKAVVNSSEWKSESNFNPYISIDNRIKRMNLVWNLPTWITPIKSCTFYLSVYSSITPGKYIFNNTENTIPQNGVAIFVQGSDKSENYINYYSTSGYVEINYINDAYMEGTFNVTLKDKSNHSIEFTNGRFKAYITSRIG